jgi:ribonucleoside-diphosphate reductase alpha chain
MEPMSLAARGGPGLCISRRFTDGEKDVWDTVEWGKRNAVAGTFEQKGVEAPVEWGDQAVGIVAKLYFATVKGVRENSVRQLIDRVASTIVMEGIKHGYFPESDELSYRQFLDNQEATIFYEELVYILLHQMAAFNTPVNLNFGVPGRKQVASACFLLSISDTMVGENGIVEWWGKEASIFKAGAGSGINVSNLRGSMETLSTGGVASGPCAYMRTADSGAGTLKSGGAHRRAAKMVCLDIDHPDILKFIRLKEREDKRMRALIEAGFDLNPMTQEGEELIAECTTCQNANFSVRITDDFMRAVNEGAMWDLKSRTTSAVTSTLPARDLFNLIAEMAWLCADPGVLYHDTINAWHTTPHKGPITTSNPCCEVHINDDASCNLSSLNLLKFVDGTIFNIADFMYVTDVMTTAMDITCSFSELPTETIEKNTRELRQLGLGYANLGATLMVLGMPYDSDSGRAFTSSVTALLTGGVYRRSAELAKKLSPFSEWEENKDAMLHVIEDHALAVESIPEDARSSNIAAQAMIAWKAALRMGREDGFRNSQATVIAPTGTISFMMGCDTTGAEPSMGLVNYKGLASGGTMKMVNGSVERSLKNLGYSQADTANFMSWLSLHGELPALKPEHEEIFATAFGEKPISPEGHVRMLAAIQPFISGATSKTVNLPESATIADIEGVYMLAHTLGVKAVAVYREGSKVTSVISAKPKTAVEQLDRRPIPEIITTYAMKQRYSDQSGISLPSIDLPVAPHPGRRRLPSTRRSITHKFSVGGYEGYITAGMYEDGTVGEIFLTDIGKEGSTFRGMMGAWATAISISLQYGVPLEVYARKFSNMRFEPEGETGNPEILQARSIVDYIMRWLVSRFGNEDLCEEFGVLTPAVKKRLAERLDGISEESQGPIAASVVSTNGHSKHRPELSGPVCGECGDLMVRAGTCFTCGCGNSTGCG